MGWKKPVGTILLWMDISNSGSYPSRLQLQLKTLYLNFNCDFLCTGTK
jgi:hypothetical protein